ncbi:MAG: hypothetical protein IAF38_19650 [Bacteroidia bacterium]|nr:hypothetical protein [Bacteroidia bacterium]
MSSQAAFKRICAGFLLCVYVFAVARPVFPLVKDFCAHLLWESEHLSTVHYENGKYHLHLDLAKESDEQQKNSKDSENTSLNEFLANHISTNEVTISNFSSTDFIPSEFLLKKQTEVFIPFFVPPPKS